MSRGIFRFLTLTLGVLLLSAWTPSRTMAGERPCALAGTSTVADILTDLGGDRLQVRLLIPGGSCPGHYDLRPGDLRFLGQADLLVLEYFQKDMPNMRNLVRAAANPDLELLNLPEETCALLPKAQERLTRFLADRLASHWPGEATAIRSAADRRIERIQAVGDREQRRLSALDLHPGEASADAPAVLCSALQEPLAGWAGLRVVGTYGRPEDLTPECFERLLNLGREHRVRAVLDNIQSGPGAGRGLAESLGAGRADLSSFPGGVPGEDHWEAVFTGNIDRMIRALEQGGE